MTRPASPRSRGRASSAGGPAARGGAPPGAIPGLWASGLAVAFLLWHARGAPLGEPVLDDLLHLRERLLGRFSLLDGAGVPYYWRPLGRQLYFAAMRPLMFDHLNVVVAIHVVVLAAAAVLIYRALRLSWRGRWRRWPRASRCSTSRRRCC